MVWQRVQMILSVSVVALLASLPAKADDCCAPAPCCAAPAPTTCTVRTTEWVRENVQCTRTCYRTEYRRESYTTYRCECVPQVCTRTCTVYKTVPEVKTGVRTVCTCVPVVENRTVMQRSWVCKPVTRIVRKCEDHGHYECRQVPCRESWWTRMRRHFRHHRDCCECCEPCCPPPMKTVRVWVPCKVWVECPVTCTQRCCVCTPVTCQVTTYKLVPRQETYTYTCCKCVPVQQTQTYTTYTVRKVAVPCTRKVAVCVPFQETYTVCRMVPHCVEKQVPVSTCCETSCCKPACETCCTPCSRHCHRHLFGGLHFHSGCCN